MEIKSIRILLVEDNEGDILLVREAFEEGRIVNTLRVVKDGKEALNYLDKTAAVAIDDLPDLILLDINLPKMNGYEVLRYLKGSETFKRIPVVMLTTSSAEKDIHYSYTNLADCYLTKPIEVHDFMGAIRKIGAFYSQIVKVTES